MATGHEAKLAFWEASAKDDAARAALVKFMSENNEAVPGGHVDDDVLDTAVKALKPKRKGVK